MPPTITSAAPPEALAHLEAAEQLLARAANQAFDRDDWRTGRRLERIVTVIDNSRRVALGDSAHYRASKAAVAADAAFELDWCCVEDLDAELHSGAEPHETLTDQARRAVAGVASTTRSAVLDAVFEHRGDDADFARGYVESADHAAGRLVRLVGELRTRMERAL